MIKLIASSNYLQMPWKNKKGMTSQIYIEPASATLEQLNFKFRLSSAPIHEKALFSKFPGFKRILMPIKGQGFKLNGATYELHECAVFSGDEDTTCELLDGSAIDLGLIFAPQAFKGQVKILKFKKSFILNKEATSTYLIYLLQGGLKINEISANEGDTFVITDSEQLNFEASKHTTLALFELTPVPNVLSSAAPK